MVKSPPSSAFADELDAEVPGALVLGLEDLDLGQAVLRDAVAEHAAGRRVALEDRDLVAGDGEVVGGRHARRARADDRDALAGSRAGPRTAPAPSLPAACALSTWSPA